MNLNVAVSIIIYRIEVEQHWILSSSVYTIRMQANTMNCEIHEVIFQPVHLPIIKHWVYQGLLEKMK